MESSTLKICDVTINLILNFDSDSTQFPFTGEGGPCGAAASVDGEVKPVNFFELFLTDELLRHPLSK